MNRRSVISGSLAGVLASNLLTPRTSSAQESTDRNGTWWRELDVNDRLMIILGFIDGINLGKNFSYWGMTNFVKNPCFSQVVTSFNSEAELYLAKVTAGQLRDGLNDFYDDYRNRSIMLPNAVWLVLQGIAGTPKEQIDKSIESWRRNAATSK